MVYVKEWMKRAGMKQRHLAVKLGWTDAAVSKHIRGHTLWTEDKLGLVAQACGCHVSDLWRHPDQRSADAIIRDLPPSVQMEVMAFCDYQREKYLANTEKPVD